MPDRLACRVVPSDTGPAGFDVGRRASGGGRFPPRHVADQIPLRLGAAGILRCCIAASTLAGDRDGECSGRGPGPALVGVYLRQVAHGIIEPS